MLFAIKPAISTYNNSDETKNPLAFTYLKKCNQLCEKERHRMRNLIHTNLNVIQKELCQTIVDLFQLSENYCDRLLVTRSFLSKKTDANDIQKDLEIIELTRSKRAGLELKLDTLNRLFCYSIEVEI